MRALQPQRLHEMIDKLAEDAGDSIWRKVGEKALTTAVTTFLTEAIKATVEIAKRAKLREQKAAFEDRRDEEKKAKGGDEQPEEPSEELDENDSEEDAESDEAADRSDDDGDDDADGGREDGDDNKGGPSVDFASYVAARRVG